MIKIWTVLVSLFLPIVSSSQEILNQNEIFGAYYEQAEEKMKTMSFEEKVGQLFLARMDSSSTHSELTSFFPGGYILFARDFEQETKESIADRIEGYQAVSKIPLVMAVDEEGGNVTRVSKYKAFRDSCFPSNQELYQKGGFSLVEEVEKEKISLLKEIGLNVNLAPVADLSLNPEDYIYKRSFGMDASLTSEYIKRVVAINRDDNFASCLKHFPGYGNNVDTHTGVAIDRRSYEDFLQNDYLPFQAGIEERVPMVLVSHNVIQSIDLEYPASLSFKVHQELREKLGFSGLILTDDLAMDAISKYTGDKPSAVMAVLAGNDFIITSNLEDDYKAVMEAFKRKQLPISLLDTAVRRILAFKYQYHIA